MWPKVPNRDGHVREERFFQRFALPLGPNKLVMGRFERGIDQRQGQMLLAGEVVEEGAGCDPRARGDGARGRGRVALLGEERSGGCDLAPPCWW